jgi:hypothetical protein
MAAAEHLARLRRTLDGPVSLGELSARLGRGGIGMLTFLCALPFLQPIPLAGLGTPVGMLLAAAGLALARGREAPPLPRFVAERRLEADTIKRLFGAAEKVLSYTERFSRPRWPAFARSPRLIGAAIVLLSLLMILPFYVPFGNPVTAGPLALLGLALLEEDGLFCALGLAGTVLAYVVHAAFAGMIWNVLQRILAKI